MVTDELEKEIEEAFKVYNSGYLNKDMRWACFYNGYLSAVKKYEKIISCLEKEHKATMEAINKC